LRQTPFGFGFVLLNRQAQLSPGRLCLAASISETEFRAKFFFDSCPAGRAMRDFGAAADRQRTLKFFFDSFFFQEKRITT
jgi:hypothetical protein